MNTDRLIQILSSGPTPSRPARFGVRMLCAVIFGGVISFLLMLFFLGIQADLIEKIAMPEYWLKFFFAAALLAAGLWSMLKTARPGMANSYYYWLPIVPIAVIWAIAIFLVVYPHPTPLIEMLEGSTWKVCSMLIVFLSAPIFIGVFWVLQHMAPVQPRLTGFMAGLFSGGVAACIYCLHCPELSPIFVAAWYLLGMLIPAFVGAILGKYLLYW